MTCLGGVGGAEQCFHGDCSRLFLDSVREEMSRDSLSFVNVTRREYDAWRSLCGYMQSGAASIGPNSESKKEIRVNIVGSERQVS